MESRGASAKNRLILSENSREIMKTSSAPWGIAGILSVLLILAGAVFILLRSPATSPEPPGATYTFPQQYSAETRSGVNIRGAEDLGGQEIAGRIYKDGDKVRTEIDSLGGDGVFINRPDLGKVFQLHAASKTITWKPWQAALAHMGVTGPDVQFQALYPVDDHGVATEMYFYKQGDKISQLLVRLHDHAPLYLVTADANGKTAISIHYANYKAGPPPASVFDLPPDYQVVPSP